MSSLLLISHPPPPELLLPILCSSAQQSLASSLHTPTVALRLLMTGSPAVRPLDLTAMAGRQTTVFGFSASSDVPDTHLCSVNMFLVE